MSKKIIYSIISLIFLFNVDIYANNIDSEENFKIQKLKDDIINIDSINIFDSKNNKIGESWSSAVTLNSGNILIGKYKKDKTYDYYELNK